MNRMENNLTKYLKVEEIIKIQEFTIGIAGCGGIGSNTANNLVRLGFKNFILVDFDKIDYSNLNRQFYFYNQVGESKSIALKDNLLLINPNLNIQSINTKADTTNVKELFKDCNIVIEGFDTVVNKKMLIEEIHGFKPLISTLGLGNYWNVEQIQTKEVHKNFITIGDFISDTDKGDSPLAPGVTIVSGKVAAAVLKWSLGGHIV